MGTGTSEDVFCLLAIRGPTCDLRMPGIEPGSYDPKSSPLALCHRGGHKYSIRQITSAYHVHVSNWLLVDAFMHRFQFSNRADNIYIGKKMQILSISQFQYTSNHHQFDTLYCHKCVDLIHMPRFCKHFMWSSISQSEWSIGLWR